MLAMGVRSQMFICIGNVETEMTKIGIIGAGRWATPYAISAKHAGAQLVGIYTPDTSGAKLAERLGSDPAEDPRKLIADSDLVVIGSPTDTHADYIVMAAEAGKTVLCASPVAQDVDQCEKIVALPRPKGFCSFPFRARPEFIKLKKAIESGDLGTVGIIRLGMCRPKAEGWRADAARSGGIMLESGIHLLDALEWLAGPVERIYGASNSADGKEYNLLVAKMADGSIAHLEVSWAEADGVSYDYYEVAGSKGLLDYDSRREPLLVVDYHGDRPTDVLSPGATAAEHELRALTSALAGGEHDLVDLEKGLELCRRMTRVRHALKAGEVLTF